MTFTLQSTWNDRDQRTPLQQTTPSTRSVGYKYDAHGQLDTLIDVEGVEEAASGAALAERLRARGVLLLDHRDTSQPRRFSAFRSRNETARAFRYLATLLESGFPLDRAVRSRPLRCSRIFLFVECEIRCEAPRDRVPGGRSRSMSVARFRRTAQRRFPWQP
ncbi:MAG: hypothetical protein ACRELC_07800 [Gemmatimonadota bacterium]